MRNRPYLIIVAYIGFILFVSLIIVTYRSNKAGNLNQGHNDSKTTLKNYNDVLGNDSEKSTIKGMQEINEVAKSQVMNPDLPDYMDAFNKIVVVESFAATKIMAIEEEKKDAAKQLYNTTKELYDVSGQKQATKDINNLDKYRWSVIQTKALVASFGTTEFFCFRYRWLLDSDWIKEESFSSNLTKYPDEKLMAVFLGFSELFDKQHAKDTITLEFGMRVNSYLLDSFPKKLTQEDKSVVITRLKDARNAFKLAKSSDINGFFRKDTQGMALIVMPAIDYAYATEILSRYDVTITSKEVNETYEKSLAKVDEFSVQNNYPMYVVNRRGWLTGMYSGYLYNQNGGKLNNKIISLIMSNIIGVKKTATYTESVTSRGAYWDAMNSELGNWDNIRIRWAKVLKAVSDNNKGTASST
jgi:predicted house-cleaning noncanonical NTP pyrophosphatase (MazG superfamily)